MNEREILERFVLGTLTPAEVIEAILADADVTQSLVQGRPPSYAHGIGSSYELLVSMDPNDPFSVHGAKEHARDILEAMGVRTARDPAEEALLETMSKLQPSWVNVPGAIMKTMVEEAGPLRGKALRTVVLEQISERFRCLGKRPRWRQAPDWQFNDAHEPMIFVGQFELSGLYHDESTAYIFADPASRRLKWSIQSS